MADIGSEFETSESKVTVRVTGDTVVVTIPENIEIDRMGARNINQEYMRVVRHHGVSAALTILESSDVMNSDALKAVERAAAAGISLGIDRWAVVVDAPSEADTFADHVVGIETQTFDTTEAAIDWLS